MITSDPPSAVPVRERGQVVADTVFYPLPLGEVSSRSPERALIALPRADGWTRRRPTWGNSQRTWARGRVEVPSYVLAIVSCIPAGQSVVACGPGLITCVVASVARHVTGIDITPAMIQEARKRQRSLGLSNMDWQIGDVLPLPFAASTFSAVITRYSYHHFLDPAAVLGEMVRVCQPGSMVAVVDVFMTGQEQAEAFNRMEKLRDPSHTRALLLAELMGMFHDAGLIGIKTGFYRLEVELEKLLRSPAPSRTMPRRSGGSLRMILALTGWGS